jgi:hypothetical protein
MSARLVARWLLALAGLGAVTVWAEPPAAEDRARVEAEAIGQAAEADRLFKQGEFTAALPLYEAERSSRAALGDLRYEAYALRAIGCCRKELGDLAAAIDAWNAARAIDAKRDDRGFEGYDWLLIGQAELVRDRPAAARAALAKAIPLLSTAIDRDHEADARLFLARALTDLGHPDEALPHLDRARQLALALKDRKRAPAIEKEFAHAAVVLGDPAQAAEWLLDAWTAHHELGLNAETAAIDRLLGDTMLDLDRPDIAAARVEEAAKAHAALDDPAALAGDLEFLAGLKAGQGDLASASDLTRRAVAAYREADESPGEIEARVALARYQSLAADWSAADATLDEALKLVRLDGAPDEQVRLLLLASDVARRAQSGDRSASLLEEAARVADEADNGALRRIVLDARRRFSR